MKNFSLFALALIGFFSIFYVLEAPNKELLNQVQKGQAVLTCHIGKEKHKVINPKMVVGYEEVDGYDRWLFKNGSATNCQTEKNQLVASW